MKGTCIVVGISLLLGICNGFQSLNYRGYLKDVTRRASSKVQLRASLESFDPVTPFLLSSTSHGFSIPSETVTSILNGIAADDVVNNAQDSGWLQPIVSITEVAIKGIHEVFDAAGLPGSYGFAIITFTLLIKVLTYPLTKTQLESTTKMQAIAPKVKQLQAKYANNPEMANQKIAQIYQDSNVNPLAGCIPAIVQIPVFISLYRALLNLAAENVLTEPFLWLPSLEGPTFGADPTEANAWLFKNWVNGAPSLGWQDTLLYLTVPLILIVSQYASTQLMQPKTDDPAQQQTQAILKYLPLLIGWFSINVPAGLGVYWIANNIITTALTVYIKGQVEAEMATQSASTQAFTPPKPTPPKGFSATNSEIPKPSKAEVVDVTPVPTTTAAEPVSTVEATVVEAPEAAPAPETTSVPVPEPEGFSAAASSSDAPPNKKKSSKSKSGKKKKRRGKN